MVQEGNVVLGRYRVTQVVDDGAVVTADVVRLGFGSTAQIFMLSPESRGIASAYEHLLRTTRAVAQMQSEHIARVLDLSRSRTRAPYVVVERSGFADLADVLRMRGALPMSEALDYAIQVADALAEAHALGIIHGSLRPSRVFVMESADGTPLAKVAGFGFLGQWSVQSRHPDATQTALRYLSPEQIRTPDLLDVRSDIWALGLLMHEMLIGSPAFSGVSAAGTLAVIAADPAPSISAARSDVPRALDSVVRRCLEKRAEERYASIAEVVRALKPFVAPDAHAKIERIVRIGARSSRPAPAFVQSQSALVHQPASNSFRTGSPVSVPSGAQSTQPTVRLGALVGIVVAAGACAGVFGALVIARFWSPLTVNPLNATTYVKARVPEQAPVSVPVNPVQVALPTQLAVPIASAPAQAPAPAAASSSELNHPNPAVPSKTRSIASRVEARVAAASPAVSKPVPPTGAKSSETAGNHLFDDIK
jgi:serine/threonine-protein kinase